MVSERDGPVRTLVPDQAEPAPGPSSSGSVRAVIVARSAGSTTRPPSSASKNRARSRGVAVIAPDVHAIDGETTGTSWYGASAAIRRYPVACGPRIQPSAIGNVVSRSSSGSRIRCQTSASTRVPVAFSAMRPSST